MFTKKELEEIAATHKKVYDAIRKNFGSMNSDKFVDMRQAENAATQIICAKIIARGAKKCKCKPTT